MAVELRVPQLGESVVEATIARWLKNVGERVEAGDAVLELETEKVNIEVPAEQSGVLTHITHLEGETVKVGDVLGLLDGQPDESPAPPAPPATAAPPAAPSPPVSSAPPAPAPTASPGPARPDGPAPAQRPVAEGPAVSPVARRL